MNRKQKRAEKANPPAAGYPVATWAPAAGLGVSTFYTLPDELKPQSVMVGARRIIIEAPADWLTRMAAQGGVPIPQRRTA